MVCRTCINFKPNVCCLNPIFVPFSTTGIGSSKDFIKESPDIHWCAQGEWHAYSERHKETLKYFWGEWEEEKQ